VQDLEATNSSAQARLDGVSLDTLLEGDSAAPANGKYLNFVAHMYVTDLTTSGTYPAAVGRVVSKWCHRYRPE
jgi:hypothetical protein